VFEKTLISQLFAQVSNSVVSETMTGFRKAPLSLATWTTLSLNLSARDKLVKIIQYVARILMWYYQRIKADDKILETIQKVRDLRQ
jgi:Peroxisomal biogenesis factor 11 (PEX11)